VNHQKLIVDFHEGETAVPQCFDQFVMVDWSAANKRNLGKDSIWVAVLEQGVMLDCFNLGTRQAAFDYLFDLSVKNLTEGKKTLIGFDFPFGYPAGTADYFALKGDGRPWHRIWRFLEQDLKDSSSNRSNRFELASELNRRGGADGGPFWGHPAGRQYERLDMRKPARSAVSETRLADRLVPKAQPVWKLAYNGSVGSQALTGIPRVHRLRFHPALESSAVVWPFERIDNKPIVLAEIYPSFWKMDFNATEIKDAQQVKNVVSILDAAQRDGKLQEWLNSPLNRQRKESKAIQEEEAWMLGL
jgi:hypothetical protein